MYFKTIFLFLIFFSSSAMLFAKADSKQQLKDVKTEIKTLSQDVEKKVASKEALFEQLKEQSRTISKLNNVLLKLKQSIGSNETKLKALEKQVETQHGVKTQQLDALGQQIRSAYFHGQPSFIKVLLNQQDPATISRGTHYFHYFHQARQQQLEEINELLSNLTQEQKQLFVAQQQQQKLYKEQQTHQTKLQLKVSQRQVTLKKLESEISGKKERLSLLREQEKSLNKLLSSLKRRKPVESPEMTSVIVTNAFTFKKKRGQLSWPLKGKVVAHYGSSRNVGKLRWKGILISAKAGKNIEAVATGDIVFADWLRGFGLLVIIDHGNQYMTLYGNNEAILKQVGDRVFAGELIARSGDKAMHQRAGLYFEVRHKGEPSNPLKWLKKKAS